MTQRQAIFWSTVLALGASLIGGIIGGIVAANFVLAQTPQQPHAQLLAPEHHVEVSL